MRHVLVSESVWSFPLRLFYAFGNTLVTQELTGEQVQALFERSVSGEWKPAELRHAEEKSRDARPLTSGLVPGRRVAGSIQPAGATVVFDPRKPEDFGDAFLLEQGYTLLWLGWQFDMPETAGLVRLYPPVVEGGGVELVD